VSISYSKVSLFTLCASRYRYKYILKLPDQGSGDAANRGSMLHELLEKYLLQETKTLPAELIKWEKILDKMISDDVKTEVQLAVDINLEPCDFDSPDAYFRGIIDTLETRDEGRFMEVGDWKSGKLRDYSSQLKFYVLLIFLCYPKVQRVGTRIRYIDAYKSIPGAMYQRSDMPAILEHFKAISNRMMTSKVFSPNPSSLCKYCPYNKNAGGPCKW